MRYLYEDDSGSETPEEVLSDVRLALYEAGIGEALMVSPVDPAGALLVAELANYAAKRVHGLGYSLKVAAFAAAAMLRGVESGWSRDSYGDPVFVLRAEGVCEISAHDPYGELVSLLNKWGYQSREWRLPWMGVYTQAYALHMLRCPALRRYAESLTKEGGRQKHMDKAVRRLVQENPSLFEGVPA